MNRTEGFHFRRHCLFCSRSRKFELKLKKALGLHMLAIDLRISVLLILQLLILRTEHCANRASSLKFEFDY